MSTESAGGSEPVGTWHRRKIQDPAVLRALSHPARLAILDHLQHIEAATATECAEVCGLSPSATSYHLRAMDRAGLVEQAPSRGDARERLWRTTLREGYEVDTHAPDQSPEVRRAALDLVDTILLRDQTQVQQYLARVEKEPPEWYAVTRMIDGTLLMTAEELGRLNAAVTRLFEPYRRRVRTDAPPDARVISAMFRAFPSYPATEEAGPHT